MAKHSAMKYILMPAFEMRLQLRLGQGARTPNRSPNRLRNVKILYLYDLYFL